MDQQERNALCDRVMEEFSPSHTLTYQDACRRVGEVMSKHLNAVVKIRFGTLRNGRLSGATARLADGTYVVYCAKSRSWYHRLGILLHELAHLMLEHEPVTLESSRRDFHHFTPHLPNRMMRILAERTSHKHDEERQAEEFADELLERLTEQRKLHETASPMVTPHVMRIIEGIGPVPKGDKT